MRSVNIIKTAEICIHKYLFDEKLPGIFQNIYSDDWEDASQVCLEKPGALKVMSLPSVKEKASVRN